MNILQEITGYKKAFVRKVSSHPGGRVGKEWRRWPQPHLGIPSTREHEIGPHHTQNWAGISLTTTMLLNKRGAGLMPISRASTWLRLALCSRPGRMLAVSRVGSSQPFLFVKKETSSCVVRNTNKFYSGKQKLPRWAAWGDLAVLCWHYCLLCYSRHFFIACILFSSITLPSKCTFDTETALVLGTIPIIPCLAWVLKSD